MDPANVCLMKYNVKCKGSAPDVEQHVNMGILYSLLKQSKGEINLSFTKDGRSDIHLIMEDYRGKFNIPFVDNESRDMTFPKLDHTNTIKISRSRFMEYVRGAHQVAEGIVFETKNGYLTLTAEDDDSKSRYEKRIKCTTGKNVKSKYSLEYLSRLSLEGRMLTIKFGKDYPIQISDPKGNTFILAPRVDC